jgi:hypothetical protein
MRETDRRFDEIEQRLRKARLAEPSAELKTRVTGSMREARLKAPAEVPWQIPIRRLAASVAAAVFIISIASLYGDHVSAPRQHHGPSLVCIQTIDLDALPEASYGLFAANLAAVRGSSGSDAPALFDYIEKVRQALSETEQSESRNEQTPIRRGSRLLPDRQNLWS